MYNLVKILKFHGCNIFSNNQLFYVKPIKVLLAHEQGAIGVVVVNNRVSVGSVVKMNLGELTHRIDFKNLKVKV